MKTSHPLPDDPPPPRTRLEIVHCDLWGKHSVESLGGCRSLSVFTDDPCSMRWDIPIKTKAEVTGALQTVMRDVENPEDIWTQKLHCDGGSENLGRFQKFCKSCETTIETSTPYTRQGNIVAERGVIWYHCLCWCCGQHSYGSPSPSGRAGGWSR